MLNRTLSEQGCCCWHWKRPGAGKHLKWDLAETAPGEEGWRQDSIRSPFHLQCVLRQKRCFPFGCSELPPWDAFCCPIQCQLPKGRCHHHAKEQKPSPALLSQPKGPSSSSFSLQRFVFHFPSSRAMFTAHTPWGAQHPLPQQGRASEGPGPSLTGHRGREKGVPRAARAGWGPDAAPLSPRAARKHPWRR